MARHLIRQAIVFAVLGAVGVLLAVAAPDLVPADRASAVSSLGAAMFAGALAFILVQAFHVEDATRA